ncbi:MAG TPA: hypothetical protein VM581_02290 [Magnetospirillaceae bacterium]|nr:hypothetical protein [Magnetospirillaceae bacterium]
MAATNINKNRKEAAKSLAQFLYDMFKEKEDGASPENDVLVIPPEDKESK